MCGHCLPAPIVSDFIFVLLVRVDYVMWPLPAWLAPVVSDFVFVLTGRVDCIVWPLPVEPVGSDLVFSPLFCEVSGWSLPCCFDWTQQTHYVSLNGVPVDCCGQPCGGNACIFLWAQRSAGYLGHVNQSGVLMPVRSSQSLPQYVAGKVTQGVNFGSWKEVV